jgi:hypothetical protein
MFIFWGEYVALENRGLVGDKCPHCGQVTRLAFADRYKREHLYFIPLSKKYLDTVATCAECKATSACGADKYRGFLTDKLAKAMQMSELLQETNPALLEELAERSRMEEQARDFRDLPPGVPSCSWSANTGHRC